MTLLFSRRLMAWLLALAVIAGASPVMAASFSGEGPGITSGQGEPAPIQAALDDLYNPAIEDEGNRRVVDLSDSDGNAIVIASAPAIGPSAETRDAHAEPRSWRAAGNLSTCHKTGPPTA